jgi:hypothetical protein
MIRIRLRHCVLHTFNLVQTDMRALLTVTVLLFSSVAMAQNGKALHDAACMECHGSLGGGDPHQLYQRSDRKVTSLQSLEKRVRYCMLAADVKWDSSQQKTVVDYLNQRFYKF